MTGGSVYSPQTEAGKTLKLAAAGSIALLVILALWLAFTSINGAVIAPGKAVVRGKPKILQSLDGGLVQNILVSNGEKVTAGQVLLRFDPTLLELRRDIFRHRLAEALAKQARLEAEYLNAPEIAFPSLPPQLAGLSIETYTKGEETVFSVRRAVLKGQIEQEREKRLQLENRITGVEAQIVAVDRQRVSVLDEIENLSELSANGLVPQSRMLELQRREADLTGRVATLRSELAENRNEIRESSLSLVQAERTFKEDVASKLQDVRGQVEEYTLEIAQIEADLARVELRAPVDGVIHDMQVATIGGVIAPEEEILKIVPVDDGVDLEVQIDPASIDSVYPGQVAQLRFLAFSSRETPFLTGQVTSISPDTLTDPVSRQPYYSVGVSVSEDELALLGEVALVPGMPVQAFLQTDARSVLNYLAEPLTSLVRQAFRES